jgi:hypothetical protein
MDSPCTQLVWRGAPKWDSFDRFTSWKLQVTVYKLQATSNSCFLTWKLVKQVLKVIIERKLLSFIFKGSAFQTKYIHSHEIELN